MPGAPPLAASPLRRVGVMLSRFDGRGAAVPSFVAGAFALAVHEMGTYAAA